MIVQRRELSKWKHDHKLKSDTMAEPFPVFWEGFWPVGEVMIKGQLNGLLFHSKRQHNLLTWSEFIPADGSQPFIIGSEANCIQLLAAQPRILITKP